MTPVSTVPRSRALTAFVAVTAVAAAGLVVGTVLAPPAHAATAFAPGDVVVYRVGTGAAGSTLAATGNPVFLDEFGTGGAAVQSVALPTASSGTTNSLYASGTATSEGLISLSPDGKLLTATGYKTTAGNTTSLSSSTSAAVPRTVAVVRASGAVDTSTALTDAVSGNNPRSAVTTDGTGVWITGGAGGVRYATLGASTSTQVSSTATGATTNLRQLTVAGGQLYTSSASNSTTIATVGSGTPTSGSVPITNIAFASGAAPAGAYQYQFLTLGSGTAPDTLYVADNSAGAIRKYSLSAGTWQARGSIAVSGLYGLAANVVNNGVVLYATTPTNLYKAADTSGAGGTLSGTATSIATAAANTAFRGVAFTPGTTIGSGTSTPPANPPTITTDQTALAAALGDPTNPTLGVTVGVGTGAAYTAADLTVTASSGNTTVAPANGISVSGTGATRTVTLTPGAVGTSTITLTVTAPDAQTATTAFTYGVSANQGDASDRYYAGAGNASAAVDVGGGYLLVGDDESDVIRLYNSSVSGLPVRTFDFTGQLPYGTAEVDIEGAARAGNTVYWMGSMSTNSSGDIAPARSTLFATTVSGSGANTTLSYVGANTTLQTDLVNWDVDNDHGLGANYFGFYDSVHGGVANHAVNSFNLEGLEFAKGSTTTAYLAFRAPIVPASNRTKALLVPVTNIAQLVTGAASHGTFGAPLQWNLGGLGIRDIKANADGDFLVLAGTADASNNSFVIYTWDGNPAHPPRPGQSLPLVPAGGQGAWEALVSVPTPLTSGSSFEAIEDNGETVWYGNGQTSKNGLALPLQKDLGRTFSYQPAAALATSTTIAASSQQVSAGDTVTFTATVTSGAGTPDGTVGFSDGNGMIAGCAARPLDASGTATCATSYSQAGSYAVVAGYAGTAVYAASTSDPVTVTVVPVVVSTSTSLAVSDNRVAIGEQVTFTATVSAASGTPTGTVAFTEDGVALDGCGAVPVAAEGTATCTLSYPHAGTHRVRAGYSGADTFAASTSNPVGVSVAPTRVVVSADDQTVTFGAPDPAFTFTANPDVTFTTAPTCDVAGDHTAVGRYAITCSGGDAGDDYTLVYAPGTLLVVQADPSVAVTASPASPVTGQTVAFTVTVSSPTAATPTGTVTVTADGATVAGCTDLLLDGTGAAQCPVLGGFAAGDVDVEASYSGDDGFAPATGSATLTVAPAATATTVAADNDQVVTGQPVTFTAEVTVTAPGAATVTAPTGAVRFTQADGSALRGCGAVALGADGSAQCTAPAGFAPPSADVTATYSGDGSFTGSVSPTLTVTVARADVQVAVMASVDPPVTGQPVTYTAVVGARNPGAGVPTGQVVFTVTDSSNRSYTCAGGNTVTLGNGSAACRLSGQDVSGGFTYTVTAAYGGDDGFAPGSGSFAQSVAQASTTTTVTSSVARPVSGQAETFTAQVTTRSPGAGTPAGTVTFTVTGQSGTRLACTGGTTATVSSRGTATCALGTGRLAASDAPYTVTAQYSGQKRYLPSSGSASQSVDPGVGRIVVGPAGSSRQGRPLTVVARVSTRTPAPNPPGGTVTFTVTAADGHVVPCAGGGAPDAKGRQSCTVAGSDLTAAAGPYTLTATWSGDDDFTGATASRTHQVTAG